MASITFPYREERSKIFGRIYRPVARVKFEFCGEWIPEWMYVDSGADITLIARSVGDLVGFEVNKSKIVDITGVGGGTVPVIVNKVMMCVGKEIFDARVAWALIEDVPPLLGRMDVFNKFDVIFKEEEKEVIKIALTVKDETERPTKGKHNTIIMAS